MNDQEQHILLIRRRAKQGAAFGVLMASIGLGAWIHWGAGVLFAFVAISADCLETLYRTRRRD